MATADSVKAKLQGLIGKANEVTGKNDADLASVIDTLIKGYDAMYSVDWEYAIFDEQVFDGTNSIDTGVQLGLKDEDMSYFVEYQSDDDCDPMSAVVFSQDNASPYQGTGILYNGADSIRVRINDTSYSISEVDGTAKIRAIYIRDTESKTMMYCINDGSGSFSKHLTAATDDSGIATYEKPLYLGSRYGTSYYFKGKIFRFGFIRRKLEDEEITALLRSGSIFEEAQGVSVISDEAEYSESDT